MSRSFLRNLPLLSRYGVGLCASSILLLAPLVPFAHAAPPASVSSRTVAMAPIQAGTASMVDLPDSLAKSVTLNIEDARFASRSVGHLTLRATNIDFRQGVLSALHANLKQGNLDNNVLVDELTIDTEGFRFDTLELLNHQRFVLREPIQAGVSLLMSEASLNTFVSHPKTIQRLEKALQKKTGGIRVITLTQPRLRLQGRNAVDLLMNVIVGQSLVTPVEIKGKLKIDDRQRLVFDRLKITSGGALLPVDIAHVIEKQLNDAINLKKMGGKHFVIAAERLKITSKTLQISGHATMTRLEFGK